MEYLKQVLLYCFFSLPVYANQNLSPEELEKWFNEDAANVQKDVNEGQLVFLDTPPDKPILYSINKFIISDISIKEGWVKLKQCYQNLDAVPVAEVVYQYRFMRKLEIHSSRNIQHAHVAGQSIQLENIQKHARLCISAEVRNFYQNEDKSFSLVSGPYHRKFLDGYYPYHLSLEIHFTNKLKFINSLPETQKGYLIKKTKNTISVDSWFEGKLNSEFRFKLIK